MKTTAAIPFPRSIGRFPLCPSASPSLLAAALLLLSQPGATFAGSSTWDLDPGSGDWNTATNWTPAAVPSGPADVARFALSNTTAVFHFGEHGGRRHHIYLDPAPNPYTITANPGLTLTISGVGITNNSGIDTEVRDCRGWSRQLRANILYQQRHRRNLHRFIPTTAQRPTFRRAARQPSSTPQPPPMATFINKGGTNSGTVGGRTVFYDSSTAGNANFINASGRGTGTSATIFYDTSSAANGFFTNSGGRHRRRYLRGRWSNNLLRTTQPRLMAILSTMVQRPAADSVVQRSLTTAQRRAMASLSTTAVLPVVYLRSAVATQSFKGTSNAANGTFINNAATASGAEGGVTEFETAFSTNNASPSAGNGTFINNGATISGAVGGETAFYESSTADAATLIANGGKTAVAVGGFSLKINPLAEHRGLKFLEMDLSI